MKRKWTLFLLTTVFIFAGCAQTEADEPIENDPPLQKILGNRLLLLAMTLIHSLRRWQRQI